MKQKTIQILNRIKKIFKRFHKNISHRFPVSPLFIILYLLLVISSLYLVLTLLELQQNKSLVSYTKNNQVIQEVIIPAIPEVEEEEEEEDEWKYLQDFDFVSDESYQKYVDPDIPFENLWYIPDDLRTLVSTHITDTRGDLRLRDTAATALEELAEDFYTHFWEKVVVVSSYRSYERQRQIKAGWCPDHLCAKAWYSEHQSGLAVDFWSASTEAYWKSSPRLMRFYDWLYDNAHLYGYHNSYQNGVEIDGYAVEPWHWRYLWVELATYLREQEITFAEFYYKRNI